MTPASKVFQRHRTALFPSRSRVRLPPGPGEETNVAFRFRLFLEDGSDVREFESAVPDWRPGDVIPGGRSVSYSVVRVVDQDPDCGDAPSTRRARTWHSSWSSPPTETV
jgi:hypothetical protein